MSISLMAEAWNLDIPSGRKLVLLSLCDNANEQGMCYPSIATIAKKCSMGERTVQQHITDLEKVGLVERNERTGRSTVYIVNPRRFCTPADSAPPQKTAKPPQILHPTPADSAPITIKEPKEPSDKAIPRPEGVSVDVWSDFVKMRNKQRAPVTKVALDGIKREAAKAGWKLDDVLRECCERSWRGFKAAWVADQQAPSEKPSFMAGVI